jgi:hypothetical protein
MDTRRRLPRQPANWPGTYHFEGTPPTGQGPCCLIDISRMGAGVVLFGGVPADPIGRRLAVDVEGPCDGSIRIRIEGEVRHVTLGSSGGVRMGVEFVGLTQVEQAILDSLEQMQVTW